MQVARRPTGLMSTRPVDSFFCRFGSLLFLPVVVQCCRHLPQLHFALVTSPPPSKKSNVALGLDFFFSQFAYTICRNALIILRLLAATLPLPHLHLLLLLSPSPLHSSLLMSDFKWAALHGVCVCVSVRRAVRVRVCWCVLKRVRPSCQDDRPSNSFLLRRFEPWALLKASWENN